MKKFSKVLASLLTVVMMLTGVVARAENYDNYTAVQGDADKFFFTKYLVLNVGTEVPETEFTFKITSGEDKEGTETTVKQIAGLEPDKITVKAYTGTTAADVVQGERKAKTATTEASNEFKVIFHEGDVATAANGEKAVNPHSGEIAAKKDVLFDFSAIRFPEPGVYRYIVEETNTSNKDVSMDEKPFRTLDVYVVDDGTGVLSVDGYVFYENNLGQTAGSADSEFGELNKFDIKNSSLIEKTWTNTKDEEYTYAYNAQTQEWEATGTPAKVPPIVVPGGATTEGLDENYQQAEADTVIDETYYTWKYSEPVTTTYTWDSTNKWWVDDHGNTNVTVPGSAVNATDGLSYSESYDIAYNTQKEAWEAEKHDDVITYPEGNGAEAGKKTDKYVNKYLRYNLIVKKDVEGNQGSKDQFFQFTVVLDAGAEHSGAVIDLEMPTTLNPAWANQTDTPNSATAYTKKDIYAANSRDDDPDNLVWNNASDAQRHKYRFYAPSDSTKWVEWDETKKEYVDERGQAPVGHGVYVYKGKSGQQVILDDTGKATVTLYLQDAEQAKLLNLPEGVKYSVNEAESNKDGYKTTGEVKTLTKLEAVIMTFEEVGDDDNLDITDYEYLDADGNEYYMSTTGWKKRPADGRPEEDANEVPPSATTTVYTKTVEVVNERNGILPTGVAVAAGAGLIMLGIGAAGMLLFGKRKEDDED